MVHLLPLITVYYTVIPGNQISDVFFSAASWIT
jgi:hypothetical protein